MRNFVLIAAVISLAINTPAQVSKARRAPQTKSAAEPVLKPFIGTWKLISSTETLTDGTVRPYGFGPHAAGYLMYDATGHMCAQVVNPDRPKWQNPEKPTSEETKTAFDGFGGYCGTYTVDEKSGTAAHVPEISFDPNLPGQRKPRSYRFDGADRLIYSGNEKSADGESHWEMVWERVK